MEFVQIDCAHQSINISVNARIVGKLEGQPSEFNWSKKEPFSLSLQSDFIVAENLVGKIDISISIENSPAQIANIISIGCAPNCLFKWQLANEIGCMRCETFCPWPTPYLLLLFIRYIFIYIFCILFSFFPDRIIYVYVDLQHISTSTTETPTGDDRKFGSMHIYNYFIAVNISLLGILYTIKWHCRLSLCVCSVCVFLWCFMVYAHCVW